MPPRILIKRQPFLLEKQENFSRTITLLFLSKPHLSYQFNQLIKIDNQWSICCIMDLKKCLITRVPIYLGALDAIRFNLEL